MPMAARIPTTAALRCPPARSGPSLRSTRWASLTRSQRLPSAEELYANGPHAATRTVELGNVDLKEETSHNAEVTLRKFAGRTTFSLSVFRNEVDDFIYAADTGNDIGGGYREIEYRQQDAVLTGAEGEVRFQATDATAFTLFGDHVRGKLRGDGGDLPRIPADRLGVRLDQSFTPALNGQLGSIACSVRTTWPTTKQKRAATTCSVPASATAAR